MTEQIRATLLLETYISVLIPVNVCYPQGRLLR
jgi:hypothetical protein